MLLSNLLTLLSSWLTAAQDVPGPTSTAVASSDPVTTATNVLSPVAAPTSVPSNNTTVPTVGASSVDQTILVIANDVYSAETVTLGLDGYGIPHQSLLVPQTGTTLPVMSSGGSGAFGGIVVVGEVGYQYPDGWYSALSRSQWKELYSYQEKFGVRMVRLNAYPLSKFGAETAIAGVGCCDAGEEQLVSITDDSDFPTANIKTKVSVTTQGLWHYPAIITNTTLAKEFAQFEAAGDFTGPTTAAVINDFGTRKQMVWFMSWAVQWSATSNFLQHSYIHWMTRGLFVGKRKTYLSAQVDDMHLSTGIYYPSGPEFRTRPADIDAHVKWQIDLNSRLPTGSKFFLEIAHNGNGDIINATGQPISSDYCNPDEAVDYPYPPDTELEFKKPLGTGTNLWDPKWLSYNWTRECADLDPLAKWFTIPENRDAFAHLSHTFSHEELNNATHHDATKEITFNQAWFKQMGIDQASHFSPHALVPPAITGLHNGDVIRAWMENGIFNVVGDNTRAPLKNHNSGFWPYYSTFEDDGHAGLIVIPRFATTIYYNCDTLECTHQEWVDTSGGSGDIDYLLQDAKNTNTRYLLGLRPDPYMFHQANMRHIDMPVFTVGSVTKQMSIIEIWVEIIAQEMTRLTNWPIVTLKQDDIAQVFVDRMIVDNCKPALSYNYSSDGSSIESVTLTTEGNTCAVPVPVTLPTEAKSDGNVRADRVGSEPLIMWVTMAGSPVTMKLATPVAI